MSAHDVMQPSQFWKLRGTDDGISGMRVGEFADVLYSREPEFMNRLESDIRERGVQQPVYTRVNMTGQHEIHGGHHRAAAAYRAGAPLPFTRTNSGQGADPNWTRSKDEQHKRDTLGDK